MHTYPAFISLLLQANSTAKSISASFKTINASFPPSSIVVFLIYLLAIYAICDPACVLPVNATPPTNLEAQICSNCEGDVNTF